MSLELYKRIVQKHMPEAKGKELTARARIMEIRDKATRNLNDAYDASGPVYFHIDKLARESMFAPLPVESLVLIGQALVGLEEAAALLMVHELAS